MGVGELTDDPGPFAGGHSGLRERRGARIRGNAQQVQRDEIPQPLHEPLRRATGRGVTGRDDHEQGTRRARRGSRHRKNRPDSPARTAGPKRGTPTSTVPANRARSALVILPVRVASPDVRSGDRAQSPVSIANARCGSRSATASDRRSSVSASEACSTEPAAASTCSGFDQSSGFTVHTLDPQPIGAARSFGWRQPLERVARPPGPAGNPGPGPGPPAPPQVPLSGAVLTFARSTPGMKALAVPSYVPLDQISVTEVPDPVPGPGQVLVRVRAAAVNPLDLALITGAMRESMPVEHPFVVGMDAAGTVAAVGEGVAGFAVGDEVVAYTHFHPGTIAEYTLATVGPHLALRPAGLDAIRGAALPAVSLSAECVLDAARIGKGQTLLIIGATGGVGSLVVQMAAQAGATVLATAAFADIDYARRLGATEVIDYTSTDPVAQTLLARPDGVDTVIDLVNRGPALRATAAAVKPGGRLVSTLMGPDRFDRGVTPIYVRMTAKDGQLQRLAGEIAAGRLSIQVSATYPLAEAPRAMADFAAGKHSRGKVVITV